MQELNWIDFFLRFLFVLGLGYYAMTLLQWYHYSVMRVITKHHKKRWHGIYFLLPMGVFVISYAIGAKIVFYLFCGLIQIPMLVVWAKHNDKPLVFTPRIKRFFAFLSLFLLTHEILSETFFAFRGTLLACFYLLLFVLALSSSLIFEWVLSKRYLKMAKDKISSLKDLKIIAITGSFGKTSVKNFLHQILQSKYIVHASPKSVNTLLGIASDINQHLDNASEIYIAEAGARNKGDIADITRLIEPHIAVITEVGEQHLEYFKTLENICETKAELLTSKNLEEAFCYSFRAIKDYAPKNCPLTSYSNQLRHIESNLKGTSFEMLLDGTWERFDTRVLGQFNAYNIALTILIAKCLGFSIERLKRLVSALNPVPHRLQLLEVNQKIIIDDGFNGNLKGMLEGIRLASLYNGRKIIVTPGLVESNIESNETLADEIDKVFDIAIITGELNSKVITSRLKKTPQKILLKDKAQLESILQATTLKGDLILFANDAPNYI
ncbi:Mur ligase family protein [Helicobacter cetorum]|uniref:UDP-N-acetylmuramoyl-tripeptide--D-alanyl-D-alanine ligase, putative membrane protein n=1 Tax=Helicobacter cetorum (strain ATCC BAA-429 / MIT 00-7128) TaxID=182217 RepID=I0EMQ0_HELC0|nr:UDP-N-acetylmuramoyl-tripeptide--D-alanyl-D-alanine ligase [Helicobacter cetorum]AFI04219.1 UDP-N-acetylmuramoyl-tripeptide--D-alanyl-D-alanine ligase, putative membrane protein [Helicobacter cetorum MIT 00-7128]